MSNEAEQGAPAADENKPVLEPEEIDALMASMAPDEAAEAMFATLPVIPQPETVESYDFSAGGENGPDKYPLFMMVQERFVEDLTEVWSGTFKREVPIVQKQISLRNYTDIISEDKTRVFIAYSVEGHGRMMLTFDIELIVAYVDAMLGGTGEAVGSQAEALSPVEQRLTERIARGLEQLLSNKWKPVHFMDYQLFKIETDPQFLSVATSSDDCFSMDFDVKVSDDLSGIFSIHYPRSFLEPILDSLRSTSSDEEVAVDQEWAAEMECAMEEVPLTMRVELGTCTMNIARFLKLSPGEMLPFSKPEQEPAVLWVGSEAMFDVQAGSQNGNLAVEVMNEK